MLKVGKLDSALLFLASSLGIVFGFLQILLGGYQAILFFIPILFLGWVFPFYIGFVEGGVLHDSPLDRTRGWIYLVVGCGTYGAVLTSNILGILLPQYPSIKLGSGLFIFVISYLLAKWPEWVTKKIFTICSQEASSIIRESINKCYEGAFYFAFGSLILLQWQKFIVFWNTLSLVFIIPLLLLLVFGRI